MSDPASNRSGKYIAWFRAHPRWTLALVNGFGVLVILTVIEMLLRSWGHVPGYLDMGHQPFMPLPEGESFRLSQEYFTDSTGTWRALPDSFRHRSGYQINAHGFRTPAFGPADSGRTRLLLIGDSFTWGGNAEPITQGFADLVREAGYDAVNLGIPGADPAQYELLADRFVPELKPDAVAVFFYMANDVLYFERPIVPNRPLFYITQLGWLNPYLGTSYLPDLEATYQYYLDSYQIPTDGIFGRICSWTVLGSRLWQLNLKMGWVSRKGTVDADDVQMRKLQAAGPVATHQHLQAIRSRCQQAGIPFFLFVIPVHTDLESNPTDLYPGLFDGMQPFVPGHLERADYNEWPDGHFNNEGHRKYAQFVLQTLKENDVQP